MPCFKLVCFVFCRLDLEDTTIRVRHGSPPVSVPGEDRAVLSAQLGVKVRFTGRL